MGDDGKAELTDPGLGAPLEEALTGESALARQPSGDGTRIRAVSTSGGDYLSLYRDGSGTTEVLNTNEHSKLEADGAGNSRETVARGRSVEITRKTLQGEVEDSYQLDGNDVMLAAGGPGTVQLVLNCRNSLGRDSIELPGGRHVISIDRDQDTAISHDPKTGTRGIWELTRADLDGDQVWTGEGEEGAVSYQRSLDGSRAVTFTDPEGAATHLRTELDGTAHISRGSAAVPPFEVTEQDLAEVGFDRPYLAWSALTSGFIAPDARSSGSCDALIASLADGALFGQDGRQPAGIIKTEHGYNDTTTIYADGTKLVQAGDGTYTLSLTDQGGDGMDYTRLDKAFYLGRAERTVAATAAYEPGEYGAVLKTTTEYGDHIAFNPWAGVIDFGGRKFLGGSKTEPFQLWASSPEQQQKWESRNGWTCQRVTDRASGRRACVGQGPYGSFLYAAEDYGVGDSAILVRESGNGPISILTSRADGSARVRRGPLRLNTPPITGQP